MLYFLIQKRKIRLKSLFNEDKFIYQTYRQLNINYDNNIFAIIRRINCGTCGLFSDYIVYLGCLHKYIIKGYIPIIDLKSFRNIFNGFKITSSNKNPWEYFFFQPFGYTLENVKKYAKKIKYFNCNANNFRPNKKIYFNKILNNFWHNFQKIYVPIKNEILIEANLIKKKLLGNSNNVLGILMRGTDYIATKPKHHPIPPNANMVIEDIKQINKNNTYDWFFIATEDDIIRAEFIKEFGYKLKYFVYKNKINYNYIKNQLLAYNENIKGNIQFIKVYLLNMIILSKCNDIISANTSGLIGIFIFRNGFRFSKVYFLGNYK